MIYTLLLTPGGRCYWEFLVGVCRLVLRILSLFQTKKCHFPHSFSDQISKIHTHFRTWPNLACSRLSDSWGDSPVFSRFIFVFSLSQFSGPNYLRALNRLGLIRQKFCHHYQVRAETKKFSKCISNSHICISFLFIWNWNDKYFHSCTLP